MGEDGREGKAQIFRVARHHWGERGASVIAEALERGRDHAEIWEIMAVGVESGAVGNAEYLAQALLTGDFQQW